MQIHENGNATGSGVFSAGNTLFDDDLFTSSAEQTTALKLGPSDELLDSVVTTTGPSGRAVIAGGYEGSSFTIRNVTAYANPSGPPVGSETIAIGADEAEDLPITSCSDVAMSLSLRNVVAVATGSDSYALEGGICSSATGTVNINVDYSDFNPGQESLGSGATITAGAHNINQPALFVNPAADDFRESPGSPTIDAGTNDPQDGAFDPDGRPRFLGTAPDIGAYEYPAADAVTSAVTNLSTTGATLNGTVDSEGSGLTTTTTSSTGPAPSYGAFAPIPIGTEPGETVIPDPQAVSVPLTGLQPGTTYDYRLVADNSDGRTFGANQTFTTKAPATLTIRHGGNGEGNILVNGPTGMIAGCLDSCPVNVLTETPYTLVARPFAGSRFAGWSGSGCSGVGMCTVTSSGTTAVTATFAINPPRLSRVSLSKRKRKLKLSLTVTAGQGNSIIALRVILPGDLRLVTAKHGVKVSVKHATAAVQHGTLRLFLRAGSRSVHVTVAGPAIKVVKRKHPQLDLVVNATESAGGYETITRLMHRT